MTTIQKFDRPACRTVSEAAEAALTEVAAQFGLTLKKESGRFSSEAFTFKATFQAQTEDGVPAGFAAKAQALDLPADCFGKVVVMRRTLYEIKDINLRARKYPVCVKRVSDGQGFKFGEDSVRRALKDVTITVTP